MTNIARLCIRYALRKSWAERRSARDRKAPLSQLASQLNATAESSKDAVKVKMLATTVEALAGAQ